MIPKARHAHRFLGKASRGHLLRAHGRNPTTGCLPVHDLIADHVLGLLGGNGLRTGARLRHEAGGHGRAGALLHAKGHLRLPALAATAGVACSRLWLRAGAELARQRRLRKVVPPLAAQGLRLRGVHVQPPLHIAGLLREGGLLALGGVEILAVADHWRPRPCTLATGAEPVVRVLRDAAAVLPPQPRGEVGRGHRALDRDRGALAVALAVAPGRRVAHPVLAHVVGGARRPLLRWAGAARPV
mmetsp:Transcript_115482/g.337787  ORF Transcript_115482/g.337787 Transcript_115482/m.337787 type:complete len:243 (+) Transcript_115482:413-1141(+)